MEVAGNDLIIEALVSFQKNAPIDTKNKAFHAGLNARKDTKALERTAVLNVQMISMKDCFIARNLRICHERVVTRQKRNASKIMEPLAKRRQSTGFKNVPNTTTRSCLVALRIVLKIWKT